MLYVGHNEWHISSNDPLHENNKTPTMRYILNQFSDRSEDFEYISESWVPNYPDFK